MDRQYAELNSELPPMKKPPGTDPKLRFCCILPAIIFIGYLVVMTTINVSESYESQNRVGIELLGDIQTAELRHHRTEGKYATLEELLEKDMLSGELDEQGRLPGKMGTVGSVVVTKDGESFEISVLTDRKLLWCDERGTIEEREHP
ncbi:hypothetical protein KDL29_02415 [bacterium]|nr:hypothetical protein [bacterium]